MSGANAQTQYPELQGGEPALIEALRAQKPCVFIKDGEGQLSAAERTIRGEILGQILRGQQITEAPLPPLKTVRIGRAVITGTLDMSDSDTELVLQIVHSEFKDIVEFTRAKLTLLDLSHSDMVGAKMEVMVLRSHLWLDDINCQGIINLLGAEIGGQLSCNSKTRQARITNPEGHAILAQGAEIKGGVFLDGARINGMADFNSAKIGGQFSADSTSEYQTLLNAPDGHAINAQGAEIKGGVFLRSAHIDGTAFFATAKISGQFSAQGASFMNAAGVALHLQSAVIKDGTILTKFRHPPIGRVDLAEASLGRVVIDEKSYPLGLLHLDGTRYSHLDNRSPNAQAGEGWLTSHVKANGISYAANSTRPFGYWKGHFALYDSLKTQFPELSFDELTQKTKEALDASINKAITHSRTPFAYRQLAKVLDGMGHEREARGIRVLAARAYTGRTVQSLLPDWDKGLKLYARKFLRWLYRVWRLFLRKTTGHGERLEYAAYWLLGLWALGMVLFWQFTPDMVPARERFYLAGEAYKLYMDTGALPEGYPKFSPFIYSLDVMLPIVDFAQESHWRPKNTDGANWARHYNRAHLALGWLLSTIGIAGLTGLLKDRRDP